MAHLDRIKILIIGPTASGKSTIANFLAGRKNVISENYRPTVGCRIMEFERDAPKSNRQVGDSKITIELWDVSGDQKFSRCWPAIRNGANGIIFAFNAENPKHPNQMANWIESFAKKERVPASLCVSFAHHPSGVIR